MTDNNTEERSLEDLVQNGTTNDVSRKLEADPINADDENYQDYYLVISAIGHANMRVAKFLIEQGFRVYNECKPHAEKTPLHYALDLADFQLIRLMLFKGAVPDIAAPDDTGRTPMHMAIERSDLRILKILLDYADKEALNDMHLLHYSVKSHDISLMKKLLKKGLSPLRKNMYGETAFCVAVKEDHVDALCLLWDSGQDLVDYREDNDDLKGMLIVAIILDNADVLGELVENTLSVDIIVEPSIDGWALFEMFAGYSLLHFAVKYVQLEIVHFLLENEADVTHQDAMGSTPFHIALENKEEGIEESVDRYKIVEEIIDLLFYYIEQQSQPYVNVVNEHGISHFHVLCTRNDVKRVKFFLRNGASLDDAVSLESPIYRGYSPLHFAARYGHKKVVELLVREGANIEREAYFETTPLHIAAKEPSIHVARVFIQYGADITKQDSKGNTPVHYAFYAKNYAVLDFLLSVHAIINANPVNSRGISHFHIACSRGDVSIVANFLLNNASISACVPLDSDPSSYQRDEIDWRGCTPLHFAAAFGRSEVVQLLLDRNACVEVTNVRGYTPFHLACQYNCEKFRELVRDDEGIVEVACRDRMYYEESFIDVMAMENELRACHPYEMMLDDEDECSIVDWSSNRKDHIQTIEQLMKAHCDVNKLDAFGNSPLFYMCYFNLKKIFARLIDAISCKRILRMHLVKSFLKEMCFRREVLLNCLFKCRHNVNLEKCYKNGSILHYVAVIREYTDPDRLELLKRFLNRGADVNATDDEMQTPLHLATKMRDVCCVNILLEYNANVNCVDGENSATPLHIVTKLVCQESIEIVQMLMLKDVDVNAKQADGKTALHNLLSSRLDFSEFQAIFGHLIVKGVDVNARDARGKTPLVMACTIVNAEIVKELLEFGADVTLEDGDGRNIYQYVYGQVKSMMKAYQKFPMDMYEIFLILLYRAVKLDVLKQLRIEKILQIWSDLKDLKDTSFKNQDLDELRNKCLEEVALLRNTKIHNDITLRDLLSSSDGEMGKYAMNDVFRAVLEEDSFAETYSCYGNMLFLKYRKGDERIQLLPKARECLTYLTDGRIPICLSEDVLIHLNNVEIRDFIRIVSSIKREKKTPIDVLPLKVEKDHSKYSRLA